MKNTNNRKKYIILLAVVLALGVLVCVGLILFVKGGGFAKLSLGQDIINLLLVLFMLLPLLLLALLIASLIFGSTSTVEVETISAEATSNHTAIEQLTEPEGKERKGDRHRFYMLSHIDEEKGKYRSSSMSDWR